MYRKFNIDSEHDDFFYNSEYISNEQEFLDEDPDQEHYEYEEENP